MSEELGNTLKKLISTLIALGIAFGLYCLIGWIALNVYKEIAIVYDLPSLNYWVFVGACYIINWVCSPHKWLED